MGLTETAGLPKYHGILGSPFLLEVMYSPNDMIPTGRNYRRLLVRAITMSII